MLLTLLSSLFGVASGVLPNIVKIMEVKQNNAHEIALTFFLVSGLRIGFLSGLFNK